MGVLCGTNTGDMFSTVAGVVTSISFMINPPSTNSQIVCCRKDRGGCGCPHRWLCIVRFCLFWWQTLAVTVCTLFEVVALVSGAVLVRFGVSEWFADVTYLKGWHVLFR